ncbi:hypothetical protein MOUN0_O11430 [Monosporozyma unispora]
MQHKNRSTFFLVWFNFLLVDGVVGYLNENHIFNHESFKVEGKYERFWKQLILHVLEKEFYVLAQLDEVQIFPKYRIKA